MSRRAAVCLIALASSLAISAGPALSAGTSCRAEVAAAFTKQRTSRAFTMKAELKGESGPVEINVEYVPPDRMRQTIDAPGQPAPLETVLVGQRAWSRQGAKWEELMPALAQIIIAQVREAVVDPPKEVGDFECAGKAAIDGKEYLTYRSIEKGGADARGSTAPKDVHRTVYVDPESGLPTFNIVKEDKPDAAPIFKGTYAYPKELVIDGHSDAPLVRMR